MERLNRVPEEDKKDVRENKNRDTFLIILVLITFLMALFLYLFTFMTTTRKEQKPPEPGDIEWVHPIGVPPDRYEPYEPPLIGQPDRYQPIEPPIGNLFSVDLYWPTISTYRLSKSICNYAGDIDEALFVDIFESEFNDSYTGVSKDTYTFDYVFSDDGIEVYVDSHLTFVGMNNITNPNHTYYYEVITNL